MLRKLERGTSGEPTRQIGTGGFLWSTGWTVREKATILLQLSSVPAEGEVRFISGLFPGRRNGVHARPQPLVPSLAA